MNEKEFLTIAAAIKATYPNSNIFPDKNSANIWFEMLRDLSYTDLNMALKEHISTNRFPPTIAELREKASTYTSPQIKSFGEAWEEVIMAIRRHGYMEEEKALADMDSLTAKCVKRIGWRNICMSDNITADRANFRMIYEQEEKRNRTDNQLPNNLRLEKDRRIEELISKTVKEIEFKEELPFVTEKEIDMTRNYTEELRRELRR